MIINWWAAEQVAIDELLDIKLNYYKKPGSEFVHPWFELATMDITPLYNAIKLQKQKEMDTNNQAGLVGGLKTSGLTFNEAMKAMHSGCKVRLPEWTGYWFINKGEMSLLTREGDILNTPDFNKFSSRDDWEIAVKGLGFDFALLALQAGKLLSRAAWKNQLIFLRPAHTMTIGYILTADQSLPNNLKSWHKVKMDGYNKTVSANEINLGYADPTLDPVKFGAYLCLMDAELNIINGWAPSQADLTATDWEVIQVPEWTGTVDHPGLTGQMITPTFNSKEA